MKLSQYNNFLFDPPSIQAPERCAITSCTLYDLFLCDGVNASASEKCRLVEGHFPQTVLEGKPDSESQLAHKEVKSRHSEEKERVYSSHKAGTF